MKNGNFNFTLYFLLIIITLKCYYQLSSQMFTSNALGMKSMTSLESLKSQIEEKRKLLQMIYSQQIVHKDQPNSVNFNQIEQISNNSVQTPIENNISKSKLENTNSNLNNLDISESKESLLEKENQEIKPLLKSIVDMQYYTYQMLKKMKNSFDELKKDVEEIKENISNEKDSNKDSKNLRKKNNGTKIKLNKEEKLIDP